MTSKDVSSAEASFQSPQWVVNITLNPAGSKAWDALAQEQFHAYIAEDLDATVIAAPLVFPNQSVFTSFGGKVQITGGLTKTTAENLVNDLESGPLPVRLEVARTS